jgi:hypothetical protein
VVCKDFLENRSRRALTNKERKECICLQNTAACNLCKCNVKKKCIL